MCYSPSFTSRGCLILSIIEEELDSLVITSFGRNENYLIGPFTTVVEFDIIYLLQNFSVKHCGNIVDDGPILLAGDFNTWLARRSEFLQDMTCNLQMDYATFSPDRRSRYFGQVLDHVFVKGLRVVKATCRTEVTSSDHRPIELVLEASNSVC